MDKEYKIGKDIVKTMLKTIIILVIVVFFACLGFYVINPRFSAKVCASLGWRKTEISCYELLYARNKDNADLYNLIVKLSDTKDYQKQLDYIDKMQNSENYNQFCTNFDISVVDNYKNGAISAKQLTLLCGTNEYISSREVINLLKLGKYEQSYELIRQTQSTDKNYELSVFNYVEYLYASDISKEIKSNYFKLLDSSFSLYLQNKENSILDAYVKPEEEILMSYLKLKINYTQYIIALNNTDSTEVEIQSAYQEWQTTQTIYNDLVK